MKDDRELTKEELDQVQGGINYSKDDYTDPPVKTEKRVRVKGTFTGSLSERELQGIRGGNALPSVGSGRPMRKRGDGQLEDFGGCGTPEPTDARDDPRIRPPVQ